MLDQEIRGNDAAHGITDDVGFGDLEMIQQPQDVFDQLSVKRPYGFPPQIVAMPTCTDYITLCVPWGYVSSLRQEPRLS
jgi:hypothetical protein